jgi:23S rRNA pseudouridine1911/1915/1917 synthase
MKKNGGHLYRSQLGSLAHGRPLIDFLAQSFEHSSAAEWSERIELGRVRIQGERAQAEQVVHAGELLEWERPPWVEPGAPVAFAILYQDDDLLAVAKPSGLPTLPGANFLENTLLHAVSCYEPQASPLHRLGRFTSGLVLFALRPAARSKLSSDWASRRVVKRYRALASGRASEPQFEIDIPIGPIDYAPLGQLHAADPLHGKQSHTRVALLEQRGQEFLCEVEIATGRPHQIRIHLAAVDHPLVGDPLYVAGGRPAPEGRALPGEGGYLLHSESLRFTHPSTGREITIRCSPPPLLRRLRRPT